VRRPDPASVVRPIASRPPARWRGTRLAPPARHLGVENRFLAAAKLVLAPVKIGLVLAPERLYALHRRRLDLAPARVELVAHRDQLLLATARVGLSLLDFGRALVKRFIERGGNCLPLVDAFDAFAERGLP
jgi:hypothetical protein